MTGTILETRQEVLKVEWKIQQFMSLKGSLGSRWISPKFRFSDTWWYLVVYPNGDEDSTEDSVGLYLYPEEPYTPNTVIFTLSVRKTDGSLISENPLVHKFHDKCGYGYVNMILRSDLQQKKAEFMVEETLTFLCILNNGCPSTEAMDTLALDFNKLLVSSTQSDLTVRLKSKTYKAHRAVLAARSDVFASALQHEMIEKESGVISIEDCDPHSFEEFLQHLYTGRANITEGNVFHLYRTADKYLVKELKLHCVGFMMENVSIDNVCDAIALADKHNDSDLKYICKEFFSKKAGRILVTAKWKSLLKTNCIIASEMLESIAHKLAEED